MEDIGDTMKNSSLTLGQRLPSDMPQAGVKHQTVRSTEAMQIVHKQCARPLKYWVRPNSPTHFKIKLLHISPTP